MVLNVEHLPLLLKGSNKLLSLSLGHQELLTVLLSLFFNLHLANHVVLVFDLSLDLADVLGDLAKVLFLEVVALLLCGESRRRKDSLNSVSDDEVLVTDETVNWALILQWYGSTLGIFFLVHLLGHRLLVNEDWVSSALLFEGVGVRLELSFLLTESGSDIFVVVGTAFQVKLARQVGANGLAGCTKAESA